MKPLTQISAGPSGGITAQGRSGRDAFHRVPLLKKQAGREIRTGTGWNASLPDLAAVDRAAGLAGLITASPSVETLGYSQTSLRDKTLSAIMVLPLLAAWVLPTPVAAQTAPLSLDQNAFLYDTNYNAFPYNSNYNGSGTYLVPPGVNWQSMRGVPISPNSNLGPDASDGREPTNQTAFGPPTANQFQGFVALGAVTVATATNLNSSLDFYHNVTSLGWPRLVDAQSNVVAVLRAAQVGGPASAAWMNTPGTIFGWGADYVGQIDVPNGLVGVVDIAAGANHSLALFTNGTVVGWGANDYGQTNVSPSATNAVQIAAGGNFSLALRARGRVVAWGDNGFKQITGAELLKDVSVVAAGFHHGLAVVTNNRPLESYVVAWGDNSSGQTNVPLGLSNVFSVAGGQAHSVALRRDGTVVAWGDNKLNQTSLPDGLSNVVEIAAGYNHTLALRADGTVVAWGDNTFGQTNVPASLSNVVAVSAGAGHSVALCSDGTVAAWGDPDYALSGLTLKLMRVRRVTCGGFHSLALVGDGTVAFEAPPITQEVSTGGAASFVALASGAAPLQYQWYFQGSPLEGETNNVLSRLNIGTNDQGNYQVSVANLLGAATSAVAVLKVDRAPIITQQPGPDQYLPVGTNLVLTVGSYGTNPKSYQWFYQSGDEGSTSKKLESSRTNTPYKLDISNVTTNNSGSYWVVVANAVGAVTSQVAHITVFIPPTLTNQMVRSGSTVTFKASLPGNAPDGTFSYSWTYNGSLIPGQTNDTLVLNSATAGQAGLYEVTLTNAQFTTKAAAELSLLFGWGDDTTGQIDVPTGLSAASSIAAGDGHSLLALVNGDVVAWGANDYGQTNVPSSLRHVVQVAAGGNHSLALTRSGQIVAWGDSGSGLSRVPTGKAIMVAAGFHHNLAALADGGAQAWGEDTHGQTRVPTGLSNIISVAAGELHSLALSSDGTVWAWGDSTFGQTNVPVAATNVQAIAAGYYHSLALRLDGTVVAWGDNTFGQTNVPPGLSNVVAVAAGSRHSLALRDDGSVASWGDPTYASPDFVANLANVFLLAGGGFHSLAVAGGRPPSFPFALTNQWVLPGENVTWFAPAQGTPPLAYQWYVNSNRLSGQTSATLVQTNTEALVGTDPIEVVATNVFGKATNSASLIVVTAMEVPPSDVSAVINTNAQFCIVVNSNLTSLTYQWWFSANKSWLGATQLIEAPNVIGVTSNRLVLTAVQLTNAGYFSAVASHNSGSLTSDWAQLTVLLPPVVLASTTGTINVSTGAMVTNWVQVMSSTNLFGYQWLLNGQAKVGNELIGTNGLQGYVETNTAPVPPSTVGTFTLYFVVTKADYSDVGQYSVKMSIPQAPSIVTNALYVNMLLPDNTFYQPPQITNGAVTILSGNRLILQAKGGIVNSNTPTYQWLKNGSNAMGSLLTPNGLVQTVDAINSYLDLGYVSTNDTGVYSVQVTSGGFTVSSTNQTSLTVNPVPVTAGGIIPPPHDADLTKIPVGGPPVVPQGAGYWDSDHANVHANDTYNAAVVTWLGTNTNAIHVEVVINNPAANTVNLGQVVATPPWADASRIPASGPQVDTMGDPRTILTWHAASKKLYATAAGSAQVYWPLPAQASTAQSVKQTVFTQWPTNFTNFQRYIANSAPVNLYTANALVTTLLDQTATLGIDPTQVANQHQFQATNSGLALLLFASGPPSAATTTNIYFQFVNSVLWTNNYLTNNCIIGQTLTNFPGHDSNFGAPYMLNPLSRYCALPGYLDQTNRANRTGPIIPVNTASVLSDQDFVLVAYQAGTNLFNPADNSILTSSPIGWPYLAVRYDCLWPTTSTTPTATIADGIGTGPLTNYLNWQLYVQNDPNQPGFNPNDEHAVTNNNAVFPLRNDLTNASQPFILVAYQDSSGTFGMQTWMVVGPAKANLLTHVCAGSRLQPPAPLNLFQSTNTYFSVGTNQVWQDRKGNFWAKAAGDDGASANIVMNYFYPMQPGFYSPSNYFLSGSDIPWLGQTIPVGYTYTVTWPTNVAQLQIGDTLITAHDGLPGIDDPLNPTNSVTILYQQSMALSNSPSVNLIDGTALRQVILTNLGQDNFTMTSLPSDIKTSLREDLSFFPTLSPDLQERIWFDPATTNLNFIGQYVQTNDSGYLLLNVLSPDDAAQLKLLSGDPHWSDAINLLSASSSTNIPLSDNQPFTHPAGLTAGAGLGTGYVTLAFGYSTNLDQPDDGISLAVIQVTNSLVQGQIEVIQSDNPFADSITVRHSSDFGGYATNYTFQWVYHGAAGGQVPPPPNGDDLGTNWTNWPTSPTTPQIVISGPGPLTLQDNYLCCRYYQNSQAQSGTTNWSAWTQPQFVPGWITRVLAGTDPLDVHVSDYYTTNNTLVNMIALAGPPYTGQTVPLDSTEAANLGLVELYTAVFNTAANLSINATSSPVLISATNFSDLGLKMLDIAGSLSDLYMLLGNEAYAEASDPTVTIPANGNIPAVEASSIHVFEGQTATRLQEELMLLRGRDNSFSPYTTNYPTYNRLVWNFIGQGANNNGQAAYANEFGVFSLADAQAQYPMGHGDAWGHYLSALTYYYQLLQNTNFNWVPANEGTTVGGGSNNPVTVDFEHEQKFAAAAAALAHAGADIVNLTYRNAYVEDPNGQWQGYLDTDTNRAWGVSEWGSRAGQAALFDWVVANGMLPPNSTNVGIAKIDRTTVTALGDIAAAYAQIQSQVDKADVGLSPLGLAKNVIPFDIEPSQGSGTHFEQIYARALVALNNARALFDLAAGSRQALLAQSDTLRTFNDTVQNQEAAFTNQLIQSFGYPYGNDIGPGGTYPQGYAGPDLFHYLYYDPTQILGVPPPDTVSFLATNVVVEVGSDRVLYTNLVPVNYNLATNYNYGLVIPGNWSKPRQAPGTIQLAQSDFLQAKAAFDSANLRYENLIQQIEDEAGLLQAQYNVDSKIISIMYAGSNTMQTVNAAILNNRQREVGFQQKSVYATQIADAVAGGLPTVLGFTAGVSDGVTFDPSFIIRQVILAAGTALSDYFTAQANDASVAQLDEQQTLQLAQNTDSIQIAALTQNQALQQQLIQLQELARSEVTSRLELYQLQEALHQSEGKYLAALNAGNQLLADRLRFRQQTAAQLSVYRYRDLAYRTFQTDALQKYRSAFDLAATYAYLAAAAYDYETALGPDDPYGPGGQYMTSIVRARSIGQISNGQPIAGSTANGDDPGLADPLARMFENYQHLKGSLGLNNPDPATIQFSLRSERFHQTNWPGSQALWQMTLASCISNNILTIPEFKRYCIPPSPLTNSVPEPGIVITFSTTVAWGENFFGLPLWGGDNSYDSSHFATKIASAGVWFANYNGTALQRTPSVYLIPVGTDCLRVPNGNGAIRCWKILEQILPMPFPVASTDVSAPNWIPSNDTLGYQFYAIRRYAALQAYNDGGYNQAQMTSSSRLIGRSVWNTRWMLIIPGRALYYDPKEAIQRFIYGSLLPDGTTRDGNGISDIKISFQTLSYPGY